MITCENCNKDYDKSQMIVMIHRNERAGFDDPGRHEIVCVNCARSWLGLPRTTVEKHPGRDGYGGEWHTYTIDD